MMKTSTFNLVRNSYLITLTRDRSLNIPFPSEREAECAYHVLRVDQEPPRSGVKKNLTHNKNSLNVSILGTDARKVRVAVTSFFENLILVTKTMEQFGPPAPSYSHF